MTEQLSPHAHTLFSIAAVQFYIPINRIQKFQFLHRLTNICYLLIVFNNSHPNGCHQLSFSFSDYIFHFQSSIPFFFSNFSFILFHNAKYGYLLSWLWYFSIWSFCNICFNCLFYYLFHSWWLFLVFAYFIYYYELFISLRQLSVRILWGFSWFVFAFANTWRTLLIWN